MARILLADDETGARDLIQATLVADGHSVTSADDGGEAMAHLAAAAGGFDLLISDIQMPVLDGLSLAQRAMAIHPGLRVVLMSGYAEGFQKAEQLKPRLSAVLSKPVSPADLRAAIAAALKV
jgi:two-component system, cell cycle response regulator CpdR